MKVATLRETIEKNGVIYKHLISFDQATIACAEVDISEFDPEPVGKYESPKYSFLKLNLRDIRVTGSFFFLLARQVKDFLGSQFLMNPKHELNFIELRHYQKETKPVQPQIPYQETFEKCVSETYISLIGLCGCCYIKIHYGNSSRLITLSLGEMYVFQVSTKIEVIDVKSEVLLAIFAQKEEGLN